MKLLVAAAVMFLAALPARGEVEIPLKFKFNVGAYRPTTLSEGHWILVVTCDAPCYVQVVGPKKPLLGISAALSTPGETVAASFEVPKPEEKGEKYQVRVWQKGADTQVALLPDHSHPPEEKKK